MIELIIFTICLILVLLVLGIILGQYISCHFDDYNNVNKTKLHRFFEIIEFPIIRFCNINTQENTSAKKYFLALFWSNIVLSIICFFIIYFQNKLPFKGTVDYKPDIFLTLHIISSLITNTCQTHHIPELHLTPLSNYFVLILLMFYSSASGIATGISFIRAITLGTLGNPYLDVIRAMTRVLFPLCFIATLIYVFLGMPNTFKSFISYETLEGVKQTLLLGPVAAFEAIKLLGENGQSCFNANSAHPFENPSYVSNFLEIISILIVPFSLIITFGYWLKNHKQTAVILSVLVFVLVSEYFITTFFEVRGNHTINSATFTKSPNWVGKETRFGIVGSSIFEASSSNVSGAANSSLDSFHPVAIALALFNLANQSIFGVQGFGLVFTMNFILYTCFLLGLMLGKTPEIFGKRIEKNEIVLSSILLLINPVLVLFGTAFTIITNPVKTNGFYEHVHYFTRVFYEFSSGAASNGSGLEGLEDNTIYWNTSLGITMFLARYFAMFTMIMLAGSLAKKPVLPPTAATLRIDTPLYAFVFLFMSIIATTLIYFPFIILGPFTEILTRN